MFGRIDRIYGALVGYSGEVNVTRPTRGAVLISAKKLSLDDTVTKAILTSNAGENGCEVDPKPFSLEPHFDSRHNVMPGETKKYDMLGGKVEVTGTKDNKVTSKRIKTA